MEKLFTKGEWVIRKVDGKFAIMRHDTGYGICYTVMCDEYDKANAHLIASAPEMYAMLQRWVDSYECVDDNYQDGVNSDTIDLLAKARGE